MPKSSEKKQVQSSERVLAWLQQYMDRHASKPGDTLPKELEIARKLKVARSSVREALTALRALGIITSRKKGGIRIVREPALLGMREYLTVRYTSNACFRDAMEFRAAMEQGLAELIFAQITEKDVARLRRIVEETRTVPDSNLDLTLAEKRFHAVLTSASRNRLAELLCAMYTPIFDTAEKFDCGRGYGRGDWLVQHGAIVETLERKNRARFLKLMQEHTRPYMRLKAASNVKH